MAKCPIPKEDVKKLLKMQKEWKDLFLLQLRKKLLQNGSDKDLEDYFALAHQRVNVSEKFEEYVEKDVFKLCWDVT